jgi:serine phosphatase RsbU (regulator of sigma subunit)
MRLKFLHLPNVKAFLIILVFFAMSDGVLAQAVNPFHRYYSAKIFRADARNWGMTEDKNGVKYIANTDGVLEYDGKNWRLIGVKGGAARCLSKDDDDNIYVCTINDFGVLEKNEKGQRQYVSLGELVKHPDSEITTVFNSAFVKDVGVFFQTHKVMYLFDPKTKKVRHWLGGERVFANFFNDNGRAFLKIESDDEESASDIYVFENGDFRKLENLIAPNAMAVLHFDGQKYLFFDYESAILYDLETKSQSKFEWEGAQWLSKHKPYCATDYKDVHTGEKIFVLGSRDDGVKAFDRRGKIVWEHTPENGAVCTDANELFTDADNTIWLLNSCGATHFIPQTGLAFKNKIHGIKSRIYGYLKHNGFEYYGTNDGLLISKNEKIFPVKGAEAQTWKILPFGKGVIVAVGNYGFHYVEGDKIIFNDGFFSASMTIERGKKDTSLVYIGHYQGFRLAKFNGKTFEIIAEMKSMPKICRSVREAEDGYLWIAVPNQGFYRTEIPPGGWSKSSFESATPQLITEGIEDVGFCKIFEIDGKLLFTANSGIFTFDETAKKFVLYNPFGINFSEKKYRAASLHQDLQGRIWFLEARSIFTKKGDGKWEKDTLSLAFIDQKLFSVFDENAFTHWISGEEALFRFDSRKKEQQKTFKTLISKITVGQDSVLFEGFSDKFPQAVFDYRDNKMRFRFTATSFMEENENKFSFFLEGFDKGWSEWTSENQKEFTNLFEGTYTFHVKSKNIYGIEGEEASFTFVVRPPWYRELYAYVAYGLLLLLLVQYLVKLNSRRLIEAKERLEKIVEERTAEIKQKNAELEQQKEEIEAQAEDLREANLRISEQSHELSLTLAKVEEQNKDITASINYAKRIQTAVLPSQEKMKILGHHFVFFRPRDIVSGDFYWAEETENYILWAAADCTGHGVPGAFMSLLGSEMLKEIVKSKKIERPDLILNTLHLEIRATLKQKENNNRDGMDIALCAYCKTESKLLFAGAHNPLIIIKNGEKTVVKGDPMGIGGEQREMQRIFTLHEFPVSTQTWFYVFTDGFQDQFGGTDGRKFMSKNFRQLLLNISAHGANAQKLLLEESFEGWLMKGKHKQIDDVLVIGVELNKKEQTNVIAGESI